MYFRHLNLICFLSNPNDSYRNRPGPALIMHPGARSYASHLADNLEGQGIDNHCAMVVDADCTRDNSCTMFAFVVGRPGWVRQQTRAAFLPESRPSCQSGSRSFHVSITRHLAVQ